MATRMKPRVMSAKVKSRQQSRRSGGPRRGTASDDLGRTTLSTLLGEFSDAISLVTVVHRSLTAREDDPAGDEEVTLGLALRLLRFAYDRLDLVSMRPSGRLPPSAR
jgi:hypothetical protein